VASSATHRADAKAPSSAREPCGRGSRPALHMRVESIGGLDESGSSYALLCARYGSERTLIDAARSSAAVLILAVCLRGATRLTRCSAIFLVPEHDSSCRWRRRGDCFGSCARLRLSAGQAGERNACCMMADVGTAAFPVFFMRSPSFLAHQLRLQQGSGKVRSNCETRMSQLMQFPVELTHDGGLPRHLSAPPIHWAGMCYKETFADRAQGIRRRQHGGNFTPDQILQIPNHTKFFQRQNGWRVPAR
jgi:hypothetical protein